MLKVGHVVLLLLRNVEGWSCSSFVKLSKVGQNLAVGWFGL